METDNSIYESQDAKPEAKDKALKFSELLRMHSEGKSLDKEATAEMRNNILLVAGEHWSKKMDDWFGRSRAQSAGGDTQKLRITKNNIHRAHRLYMSSIQALAPGVVFLPRNELEMQDRKDAELNQAVWNYFKVKYKFKSLFREFLSDFIGIGECTGVIKFDPTLGKVKGYEPLVDEETGEPLMDETGQQAVDETKPVMTGEFVFSRRYGHNLFRDGSAQQMKDCKWIGFEVLESSSDLRRQFADQPDKLKFIDESREEYVVFDANRNGYSSQKDQTLVMEIYYKPCHSYPDGYYYQFTKSGLLNSGKLPGGIFPVVWQGFDEHATKCRATSMVKIARPYNAELNRASSQCALHQITLSEDKILYQSGSTISDGGLLPGVRGIKYNGAMPTILPGRTGDQYYNYIDRQYTEMDRALMLDQLDAEKSNNLDPYALMFRSMSNTQKFSFYSDKFGEFLVNFAEVTHQLGKFYLEGDELIAAIGKSEVINIEEFKKTSPLYHSVQVEEQAETSETKLGKQLTINQILQYTGSQLSKEDIGKMITQLPYGNWKEIFASYTLDEKNCQNDMLALERGQQPMVSQEDDSTYVLKQVARRKKERDFLLLDPFIQQMYQQYEQYHLQKKQAEEQKAIALKSEYIPSSGAMIACEMYKSDSDPNKAPKRVRVPYQALDWLVNTLEKQGMSLQNLENMNAAQANQMQLAAPPPQGMPQQGMPPQQGQASPGVM